MTKPRRSILNPEFRYFPAAQTSVARTFARERKRLRELDDAKANVTPIRRPGK